MNQRLLLIGGNYFPEPTGIGKYNGEMIDWLSQNGLTCTVITTYPYYPYWKVQKEYQRNRFWFKKEKICTPQNASNPVTIIRCPHYVPQNPTGIKRLISEFTIFFSCYLVLLILVFSRKFHYVLTVAPPFQLGLLGVMYKKLRGAKFLYHIQDLQIDAARDLGMITFSSIINALLALERFIIRHADSVSAISEGMIKKVKEKQNRAVAYFPNWVDTNTFYPMAAREELKEHFGFALTDKVILYSGAIGEKQGLESIVQAAKTFEQHPHARFVICGSGPYKEELVKMKEQLGLNNLSFLPLQAIAHFNLFLNMADVHLVLQKAGAGDLVMPSKLSTILCSGGVSIVTALPGTSLFDIMKDSDMGIVIEPENQQALVEAIQYALSTDLTSKRANARQYAQANLSRNEILAHYAHTAFDHKATNSVTFDNRLKLINKPADK